jgi:hypothetical protein
MRNGPLQERDPVPLSRAFNALVFAFWVSVCAAAPEFIWRGLVALAGHLAWRDVYSAILIAMLLGFFVEPIMERLRTRRWKLEHRNATTSIYTAAIALVFGVAAVSVHEAMNAYLGGAEAPDHEKQANLVAAIEQVQEWALIPFAVTLAWFGARAGGWVAVLAGILAGAWVVAVGLRYEWAWREIGTTSIPCFAIIALGTGFVVMRWDDETFLHLAVLTAAVAASWFVLAWLAESGASLLGAPDFHIYSWDRFWEDFRFYLGWSLGLAVAPNPVPRAARAR